MIDPDRWDRLLTHIEHIYEGQPDRDERVAEAFASIHQLILDESERAGENHPDQPNQ